VSAAPVLVMDRVSLEAPGAGLARPVLQDFSLLLERGELIALVGESGSGKSMAARAILQLLPPGVRQCGGRILFAGTDLAVLPPAQLRAVRGAQIGLVMQEPMVSLNPAMTIYRQLEEGLRLHRELSPGERYTACHEMLARVGIPDPPRCLSAFPHEFSGGQRQRIMLASVMLLRPKLLIADEPTTALDTLNQREVLDLIVALAREAGVAVMLITHNLALVGRYAQRVVVLEKGRIVETGAARAVLESPQHEYTRTLVASLPRRAPPRDRFSAPTRELLTVTDLRVKAPQRKDAAHSTVWAVDGVSLKVRPAEILAVVGGSGSGKTTLGRAILGLIPRAAGEIELEGIDPLTTDRRQRAAFRRATQLIFQDPYASLDPRMRVLDIVGEPLRHVRELTTGERRSRAEEMLEEVGLRGLAARFPRELSGGQRQRVAIARAVVARPKFVVADEPVSALDATIQSQVLALFRRLQRQYGFASLFITHELGVVEQIADRVIVMQRGRIVEEGAVAAVFDHPQAAYTRELLEATPTIPVVSSSTQVCVDVD